MRLGRKAETFTTSALSAPGGGAEAQAEQDETLWKSCVRKETCAVILCGEGGDVFLLRTAGDTGSRRKLALMLMN